MRVGVILAGPVSAAASASAQIEVDITGGISAADADRDPGDADTGAGVDAGGRYRCARQPRAEVITADLKGSGLFSPLGPGSLRPVAFPQVAAPDFTFWTTTGAQALVQGFVRANGDGTLTVGCYLYDVFAKTSWRARASSSAPGTGAAPRINAPTWSIPG